MPLKPENRSFNIGYWLFAIMAVLFLQSLWTQYKGYQPIAYSEFIAQLKADNVEEIAISDRVIQGTFKTPIQSGSAATRSETTRFTTTRVDPEFAQVLDQYNVRFAGVVESTWLRDLLSWIVPMLALGAIWYFFIYRLQTRSGLGAGLMSIGKSKAKVYVEKSIKVTLADVAGVDEAKEELKEIIGFLKDPASYGRLGARMPKGVLLVGPPGTGKTLLARAVAGEANVPFFSINGSEFVEMFVGLGAARVRDLFEEARKQAPAIIFIDELDALGRARGAYPMGGGHDEKEQTLNQLLAELDGFDPSSGLILLAATNRPEILDPALLRAGRFDRQVLVDRPDRIGRAQILRVHVKKIRTVTDLDLDQIAALTPGFSGADLANLVNEAALLATRDHHERVTSEDFTAAIERIVAGLEKRNRLLSPKERKVVAYHEMGHALVAMVLPGTDPVQKISIIPRGIGALGYTLQRPIEDRYLMTRSELETKLTVLLGGRAAELLVFNESSTGASDDLAKASEIARSMVTRFGMDETLGPLTYEAQRHQFLETHTWTEPRTYAEQTAREIDLATRALIDAALSRSLDLLKNRRNILDRSAALLLEKETLHASDIQDLVSQAK